MHPVQKSIFKAIIAQYMSYYFLNYDYTNCMMNLTLHKPVKQVQRKVSIL